jgi:putative membrane protein
MRIATKLSCLTLSMMALLCNPLAQAQSPSTDSAARTNASSDSPDVPKSTGGVLSSVSRADRKFYIKLAEANLAEIESARLALSKTVDVEVKNFAQHMLDDHSMALNELSTLAARKHVELPSVPDEKHRKLGERMKALSPIEFNSQYAAKSGVEDHRATLKLLDKVISSAKDEDLKALAEKMKPKVQAHLKMALDLTADTDAAAKAK